MVNAQIRLVTVKIARNRRKIAKNARDGSFSPFMSQGNIESL
jgi:hypothetical protein